MAPQSAERPASEAQSLDDAVASLTAKLLARAQIDPAEKRVLVVDPVIDRATGNQAAVTRAIEPRVVRVVGHHYPRIETTAFTFSGALTQPRTPRPPCQGCRSPARCHLAMNCMGADQWRRLR